MHHWEGVLYIILEYYLLENLIINSIILYSTNRITKSKVAIKNIAVGTTISTIYSLIVFLPSLLFLSGFIFKIFVSALIVYITFKSKSIKSFFYQWFCFYIVSFTFAGAIISLSSNFTNISKSLSREVSLLEIFSIRHILLGIIIALFISLIVFSFNHRKKQMERFIVDARIIYRDREVLIKALIDTGNTLKDPLSNRSVFVVELSKLESLLPEKLVSFYDGEGEIKIEELPIDLNDSFPILLIPFKSLGNDNGLILGFRPDNVFIKLPDNDYDLELSKIIIGVYNGCLSSDDNFSGLLDYESIVQKTSY